MDRWAAILGDHQEGKMLVIHLSPFSHSPYPVLIPVLSSAHPFQVDSAREVCLVQFEDDSQFLVLWKDISPGETLAAWEYYIPWKTETCLGVQKGS